MVAVLSDKFLTCIAVIVVEVVVEVEEEGAGELVGVEVLVLGVEVEVLVVVLGVVDVLPVLPPPVEPLLVGVAGADVV